MKNAQQDTKRLVETFIEMVEIDSESREECEFHNYLKKQLRKLDIPFVEDDSMKITNLGGNNIIAKWRGNPTKKPIFFSAHTDTVAPGKGIQVVERDGKLYSKGETILGADDKAGIAIIFEVLKRIKENEIETAPLEFIFSPGEEIGLIGSRALNPELFDAKVGYVLDSPHEVGRVTVGSPHLYSYTVKINGKAAHAGLEPEKGQSVIATLIEALPLIQNGRIDEETTANIGKVAGGEAINIVMDEIVLHGEVRSISDNKALKFLENVTTTVQKAAKKTGTVATITTTKLAEGFKVTSHEPAMKLLKESLTQLCLPMTEEVSGGGSDANSFQLLGRNTVNLSIGYDKIHTTDETVSVHELEKAVNLVITLAQNALKEEYLK